MFLSTRVICTLTVIVSLFVMGCGQSSDSRNLPLPLDSPGLSVNDDIRRPDSVTLVIGNANAVDLGAQCQLKPDSSLSPLWHVLADKPAVPANDEISFRVGVLDENRGYRFRCRFATTTYPLEFSTYSETVTATTGAKGPG